MDNSALNPVLFRLLRQRLGTIIIANQGCRMVSVSQPDPFHRHRQRKQILSAGEYYRVSCGFCGEDRHRLWINHMYGQPDERGYRETHLAICFNNNCLDSPARRHQLEQMIFGLQNRRERVKAMPIRVGSTESVMLTQARPPGTILRLSELSPGHPALQFCYARRWDPEVLQRQYGVGFCVTADDEYRTMQGRLYIPIFMKGELVGWQGRWPADLNWKQVNFPKYYGMRNMPKRLMLYNYDEAIRWPFVVVVESVTSVWRINRPTGGPAVAIFGKSMSEQQRLMLQQHWQGKPIILVLDPDARDEMDGVFYALRASGRNVVIPVHLPAGRDPDDFERDAICGLICAAAREVGLSLPLA